MSQFVSTFSIMPMTGRIAVVHDTEDETIISELTLDEAGVLLEQLEAALSSRINIPFFATPASPKG